MFCYTARTSGDKDNDCNAKSGNPFGPFWDTFVIAFDASEFFSPLFYDTQNLHDMQRWKERYTSRYGDFFFNRSNYSLLISL